MQLEYDTRKDHKAYHQDNHENCSLCQEEKQAKDTTHAEMLRKHPALINRYGSNYPLSYRPE